MSYKVIEQECSTYDANGEPLHKTSILVDTESDIPEPLDSWDVGSSCLIADTQTMKFLNNEREWV